MVKPEALKSLDGEPLFDANDLVFYLLPEDSSNGSTVKEIEANLRMEEHFTGLQTALNMLALKTGFGSNHWKFDSGHITAATQVIAANSEAYRTQCKHEILLKRVLTDLARIMADHGAINACNLDGGSSSSMYCYGEYLNSSSSANGVARALPDAFLIRPLGAAQEHASEADTAAQP